MAGYRWDGPHEWLEEKLTEETDPAELRAYARLLLAHVDADQIQDLFQSDMDRDGYFHPLDNTAGYPRRRKGRA